MSDNENRSTPYIGNAEVKPPVPIAVRRLLFTVAMLSDLAAVAIGLFLQEKSMLFVLFPLGFGQIFLSSYIVMRTKRARCTKYVAGQVSGTVHHPKMGVLPIISYVIGGETYRVEGNVGRPSYKLGEEIWVYFNPDDPHEATQELPSKGIVFAIVGGIVWGIGELFLLILLLSCFTA